MRFMHKLGFFAALLALCLSLGLSSITLARASAGPTPAQLTMQSQQGDYIGQGANYFHDISTGSFQVIYGSPNTLSINYNDSVNNWSLTFSTRQLGKPIAPGVYTDAQRYPFEATGHPGLSVDGDGRGCNTLTGSFTIKQITLDTQGNLLNFALSFEQHCEGFAPALIGNMVYGIPTANAPTTTATITGQQDKNGWYTAPVQVTLSATDPHYASNTLTTFYKLDSGSVHTYTAPVTISGTQIHSIYYWSTDPANNKEIAQGQTIIISATQAKISPQLTMFSQSGDYIGQGGNYNFNGTTGTFKANTTYGNPDSITINYSDPNHFWSATFSTHGLGIPLATGVYTNAQRAPFAATGFPGLDVDGDGRGCNNLSGSFTIQRILLDNQNKVLSFAASFEQHCEGFVPALFGWVTYDSTPPVTAPILNGPKGQNGWFTGPVGVTLTATDYDDSASDLSTFYQLDSATSQKYTTPFTVTGDLTHTLTFWSVDPAGNKETAQSIMIPIDKTAPSIVMNPILRIFSSQYRNSVLITVSGTVTDTLSGVDANNVTYSVKDEYNQFKQSGPVMLGSNGSYKIQVLLPDAPNYDTDGTTFTVTVKAKDLAGNSCQTSRTVVAPAGHYS